MFRLQLSVDNQEFYSLGKLYHLFPRIHQMPTILPAVNPTHCSHCASCKVIYHQRYAVRSVACNSQSGLAVGGWGGVGDGAGLGLWLVD